MKHIVITILLLFGFSFGMMAQGSHKHFDPEKYNRDMESWVTKEAKLTSQEATAFFPILREMKQKQRELFKKQKHLQMSKPNDESSALEAIKGIEATEMSILKLQQEYHKRFLKVLPATKVLACLRAYEAFNRDMMRKYANPHPRGLEKKQR